MVVSILFCAALAVGWGLLATKTDIDSRMGGCGSCSRDCSDKESCHEDQS